TDVYIRGALGEILALTVMPIFLLAIYRLFFQQRKDAYFLYLLSLSLMALSHNITFIFVVILSIIFFFIQLPHLKSTIIIHILLAAFLAFLLTSFYTLPMIEQLLDQKFVVAYYQDHNTTPAHALNLYHYFSNETIFGYSGVDIEKDKAMVLNIGYFLSIIPLFYLTLKKEKKSIFLTSLFIIGYTTLVLPIKYIPWQFLSFLSFMQFPWRLFTISSLCLSIVSAYTLTNLKLKHMTYKVIACILLAEGIYHIAPVMQREFVMKESQSWKDIQSGALCDPYYSADYMRIELAGGEYLPYYHVNFKDYPYAVRNQNNMITEASLRQNYLDLEILFPADNGIENILPITYYKGYQVYDKDHKKVETYATSSGFVAFTGNFQKEYHCLYEDTPLKTTCLYLSFFTLIFILYLYKKQEA
ncbi:MAG: hypothetical protein IJ875_01275, partial [Solobacterium sp.]|nr:hypothetical protein [Solobacterium sp.]